MSHHQVPEDERKFQEDLDLALAMSLSESNSVKTLSNNPPNLTPDPHPTTSTRETAPTTASSQPSGSRGSSISSRFTSFIQGLFPSDPNQTNNTNTARTCGRCGQLIRYGRYLTINNECFHADCFRCSGCGESELLWHSATALPPCMCSSPYSPRTRHHRRRERFW